ncbi:MAG: hypothetical protein DRR08_20475 [Candidatus Parabeggiatoa sp. nov. 2]|nr:MAG: hypothetical protein B6247_13850 [Beggiatoa sp. 4572_84]RKZ56894.1 MAG: hypothetical protein DRR08_20475 [Gammaproteobacteria bacterium]
MKPLVFFSRQKTLPQISTTKTFDKEPDWGTTLINWGPCFSLKPRVFSRQKTLPQINIGHENFRQRTRLGNNPHQLGAMF